MTTLISTCNTKSEFKDRVRAGINITMFDPSARGVQTVSLREMHDNVGYEFEVTNRRRSWHASVTVKPERKLVVK